MEGPVRSINRLSEDVVNKIAAGEVVQRPANAIKEMLENSLDAKSTNISITLKEGGLKFLQIQDNGCGIKKADMDIVCHRFTTSKLTKFEDLSSISTYGFRGEALASISHVAHVSITSRTSDSICAYKGCYSDGRLKDGIKSCAGNIGTQITVEDLFYNMPLRRHALKSPSEEHQKIVDVVTKYAIHNAKVGFLVRKQSETGVDVRTPSNSTKEDNIRILYGPSIARELLRFEHEDRRLCFKVESLVTNANYSSKKRVFVLFINDRLVESTDLRKIIENAYTAYLPKSAYPFVYISLHIDPHNIDVNVHPTKSEVHFLNEVEIFDQIQRKLDVCLLGANQSRTYFTQTLLPSAISEEVESQETPKNQKNNSMNSSFTVRSDSKTRKLDAYFVPDLTGTKASDAEKSIVQDDDSRMADLNLAFESNQDESVVSPRTPSMSLFAVDEFASNKSFVLSTPSTPTTSSSTPIPVPPSTIVPPSSLWVPPAKRRKISLSSITQLQKEIESDAHAGVKDILKNSSYVGCIDGDLMLLQHLTKLYLVNIRKLSKELFYQIAISDFGNFGVMRLSEPVSIFELSMLALEDPESGWTPGDGPKEELSKFVVDLLKSKSEMLWDYFSLQISRDGDLCTLPMLLDNHVPHLDDLPKFIIRLATEVDWEKEKNCFKTLAIELSQFYTLKKEFCQPQKQNAGEVTGGMNSKAPLEELDLSEDEEDESKMDMSHDDILEQCNLKDNTDKNPEASSSKNESESGDSNWKWMIEHAIYPAVKSGFAPPKKFANNGSLLQLANLPDLYKVFERC